MANQRGFYRVEYPLKERPTLEADGERLEVMDCSESGLRFALSEARPPPEIGAELRGVVRFRDGVDVEVEGTVARVYGRSAALRFEGSAIPFSVIMSEQHYLRRRYMMHLK